MTLKDALLLLELPTPFTRSQLKKAYGQALKVWHPDRFQAGDDLHAKAHEKTRLIIEAFEYLSRALGTSDSYPPPLSATPRSSESSAPSSSKASSAQSPHKTEPLRREPQSQSKTKQPQGTTPATRTAQMPSKTAMNPSLVKALTYVGYAAVFAFVASFFNSQPKSRNSTYAPQSSKVQSDYTPSPQYDRRVDTDSAKPKAPTPDWDARADEFGLISIEMTPEIQRAALRGEPQAQFIMGYCYEYGIGVKKNVFDALDWYPKAANQGYAPAKDALSTLLNSKQ